MDYLEHIFEGWIVVRSSGAPTSVATTWKDTGPDRLNEAIPLGPAHSDDRGGNDDL